MHMLRKYGLTLHDVAVMLSELDDLQFYEVMEDFRRLSLLGEKWDETLGEWLKNVIDEIQETEVASE